MTVENSTNIRSNMKIRIMFHRGSMDFIRWNLIFLAYHWGESKWITDKWKTPKNQNRNLDWLLQYQNSDYVLYSELEHIFFERNAMKTIKIVTTTQA